ncbi:hypothetical protein MACK_002976 [Theileria orientalis]|uniref:Serine aminopeptidase S33 domain-containing protein n=1 Tax=Theileria orientalis TaxID=68886 RepID=A0A976QU36_THEOR|nr:hypothetical protein MACK_002976 [Theileria orientalis]
MLDTFSSIEVHNLKEGKFGAQGGKPKKALCCLAGFRNLVVNRISFPKRLPRGYKIDVNGEFLVYFNGRLTDANDYLRPYNLRCTHKWVGNEKSQISVIHIHSTYDNLITGPSKGNKGNIYILFSHGNNTDVGHMFFMYTRMCCFLGVNLVSYDYNGYGHSSGKPTEMNWYENEISVYKYMRDSLRIDPKHIILYGKSLGSAPACFLISKSELYPVGGLILHSPLASGLRVFFKSIIKHRFDAFDNAEFLKNCPLIPVFLLHGIADDQIPIEQAVELTCIVKESHEVVMSKRLNQNNKFHLENVPNPKVDAEHSHLNQESIEVIPRGRFSQVIQDARKINQTNQYVKTWWIEGAGHNDIERIFSADYYDHLSKFLDLYRKWLVENKGLH